MPCGSALDMLVQLEKKAVQAYFSDSIQLADIIEWVLRQTGPAAICISTFSTSEEFLRRLFRLKKNGLVLKCSLFCDIRAVRKTAQLYHFVNNLCDSVHLCENHSKVVILENASRCAAIVTSQNQTRGNRFEAGIITTDSAALFNLRLGFDAMAAKSLKLDDIFKTTD